MLGIELRTLHMPSKYPITEVQPSPGQDDLFTFYNIFINPLQVLYIAL